MGFRGAQRKLHSLAWFAEEEQISNFFTTNFWRLPSETGAQRMKPLMIRKVERVARESMEKWRNVD